MQHRIVLFNFLEAVGSHVEDKKTKTSTAFYKLKIHVSTLDQVECRQPSKTKK